MIFIKKALKMALVVLGASLLFPRHVYSYIDPGTGSYVFQVIIATVVAVSFAVKIYWNKIKGFLARLFSKKGR